MPVSSLDYSLVDAKDDLHSYISFDSSFGDDRQRNRESPGVNSSKASSQDLGKHLFDNEDKLLIREDTNHEVARAGLWASYLGLSDEKQEEFPKTASKLSTIKPVDGVREVVRDTPIGASTEHDIFSLNDLPPHRDEAQVMLDIKRSFTVMSQYNSYNSMGHSSYATILSVDDIEAMRKRLYCLIVRVLRKYPSLNYYQGYHDIASIVLLVCTEGSDRCDESAFHILEVLTLNHLRDFMTQDIALTINHLKLIPVITESADSEMFELMRHTNNIYIATDGGYYDYKFLPALSAILTLLSHDLTNSHQLLLVWDFILGHSTVAASAYIYVALLKHHKSSIFDRLGLDETLQFEEVDLDLAHSLLSPSNLLSDLSDSEVKAVLGIASNLMMIYPINNSPVSSRTFDIWFKQFNRQSVIMTTSKLTLVPYARCEPSKAYNAQNLESIVKLQESQQQEESEHEAELLRSAFDQIDSLSTSINSNYESEESSRSSLMSSILSLKAVSSSINHTVVNSSSNLLKRITSYESNESESIPTRRSIASIYRVSLTIGFVGVVVHLLLKQSDFGRLLEFSPRYVWSCAVQQLSDIGQVNFLKIASKISAVADNAKEYGPIKDIAEVTQVGLGSLKRSLYSMAFQ